MGGCREEELKKLWKCNDKIATEDIERIKTMNCLNQLTPAVLAYEGIAYKYMAPAVFEDGHFMAENHIENPEGIKEFDHLCYVFRDDISSDREYIFERKSVK